MRKLKLFIIATTPYHYFRPFLLSEEANDDFMKNIFPDFSDLNIFIETFTNDLINCDYPMFYSENFVRDKEREVGILSKKGYFLCENLRWYNIDQKTYIKRQDFLL